MIPQTDLQWQRASWQQELRDAFRKPADLLDFLGLPDGDQATLLAACDDFPMLAPRSFARRMMPGDADDPLLRQVLPLGAELDPGVGYVADPLQEQQFNPVPGLIHKYDGRVLLISAAGCAVNCRYCFRRHFDYPGNQPSPERWQAALDYIAADASITEVLLSGGDPLLVGDTALQRQLESLDAIPHLKRLRIHTRLPVVLPARVTASLTDALQSLRLQSVMVIHCNHANELDAGVATALQQLRAAGVALLNQSVLLRGVNDNVDALAALSEALWECGVQPYYLHLLDKVRGAAHFDVPQEHSFTLYDQLRRRSSGYLVPRLVREEPGAPYKVEQITAAPAGTGEG